MRHPGDHSITGVPTACALAFWVSVAAAQVVPGDPSSSAVPESPGATGTVRSGGAPAGSQTVIPVGPGPSYPRVPRGIAQPPEPFGPQSGLGIEPLSPLPESQRPLSGSLGVARLGDLEGPPTGLTIDQAIDRVLRINLELRAQAMEISKARADVLTAGLRGNPLIYMDSALVPYATFAGTAGGPTQCDVNITHPLDLNHKRRRTDRGRRPRREGHRSPVPECGPTPARQPLHRVDRRTRRPGDDSLHRVGPGKPGRSSEGDGGIAQAGSREPDRCQQRPDSARQ